MKKINNKSINLSLKVLTILAFGLIFIPFNKVSAQSAGYNYVYSSNTGQQVYNPVDINNPSPSIDAISPKSSNLGVGTKTITITGSGFVPSSVARINSANRTTTFIDRSHLLVQITGNDTYAYKTNGGFYITVYNGAPGGGFSNAVFFIVNSNTSVAATNNANNYNYGSATTNYTDTNTNQNTNDTFTDTPNDATNPDSGNALASNAIFGSNSFLPSGLIQWILFAIFVLIIVILARRIFGAKENYETSPLKHE
ncbi:hypothetical protein HY311_03370 [Candidatus Nomurabacteria bacterium]|nr:hypothetical protein [Candidatus Nomurabacteria bacterium]